MRTKRTQSYWLFKSEPSEYSIDDLARDGVAEWTGIRNYQVRNMLRDQVKVGDKALFYHSSTKDVGCVGVMEVVKLAYPDAMQFDNKSAYFDPKAKSDAPRWLAIDLSFIEKFPRLVTLQEMRQDTRLAGMMVLKPGNRLSITPVSKANFEHICALSKKC